MCLLWTHKTDTEHLKGILENSKWEKKHKIICFRIIKGKTKTTPCSFTHGCPTWCPMFFPEPLPTPCSETFRKIHENHLHNSFWNLNTLDPAGRQSGRRLGDWISQRWSSTTILESSSFIPRYILDRNENKHP